MLMSRRLQHWFEVAGLYVLAKFLPADDKLDTMHGKLLLQSLHTGDGGIISIADSKNNLVVRVILEAMTAEALVNLGINSLQRFQNGNRGEVLCGAGALARLAFTPK